MDPNETLTTAAKTGNLALMQQALAQGANVDALDYNFLGKPTALWVACIGGRLEVAQLLLDKGANVHFAHSRDGKTPLMAAIDYPAVIQLLLERGAQVNATDNDGWTALLSAAAHGRLESMQVLVRAGADVNRANTTSRYTPLMACARSGHLECARLLTASGVDLNARNAEGHTALWMAAQFEHPEVAKLLRSVGAA